MKNYTIFTIGFTRKSAEQFFSMLINAGVRRVIDIRLNNISQLAGFTKRDDLQYFLKSIGKIDYSHEPMLAPTQELLVAYKGKKSGWETYQNDFRSLLDQRKPENYFHVDNIDLACLLCSEPGPDYCHRRLVAEYFQKKYNGLEIVHLQ